MKKISGRWSSYWQGINQTALRHEQETYIVIWAMYSGNERFYHTLDHIADCLDELDLVRDMLEYPDEVEAAIWFHDVYYDVLSDKNEETSAGMARALLKNIGLPAPFVTRVSNLILATTHSEVPDNPDARFLLDIDLSIFGKTPEEFDEYERNIRKEYSRVPGDQFRQGRSTILQRFLKRAEDHTLYLTDFFKSKYESQARSNLERLLGSYSPHFNNAL